MICYSRPDESRSTVMDRRYRAICMVSIVATTIAASMYGIRTEANAVPAMPPNAAPEAAPSSSVASWIPIANPRLALLLPVVL